MAKTPDIKTYNTESFREDFIHPGEQLDAMLKPGYGKFFIVRIEDMIRLMKLPVPPNRQVVHTLMYITEGEAIMNIGSETYHVLKNECLVVAAGSVFSIGNVDVNSCTGYLCTFHNDMIAGKFGTNDLLKDFDFLRVWGHPHISLGAATSDFVLPLFRRLLQEYAENGIIHPDIIQSYLIALLCEINGAYQPAPGNPSTHAVQITNRFREFLFSHIRTHHRVADYATLLHITPNHLNKTVKSVTGKSPTKWIDETIVLEAKVLLHQSDFSISEIAMQVGFEDQSYFTRLFRKYEGITPTQFRKKIEMS